MSSSLGVGQRRKTFWNRYTYIRVQKTPLCIEGSLTEGTYSLFWCLASNSDTINQITSSQYLTAVDRWWKNIMSLYWNNKLLFQLHMKKHTIHTHSARTDMGNVLHNTQYTRSYVQKTAKLCGRLFVIVFSTTALKTRGILFVTHLFRSRTLRPYGCTFRSWLAFQCDCREHIRAFFCRHMCRSPQWHIVRSNPH